MLRKLATLLLISAIFSQNSLISALGDSDEPELSQQLPSQFLLRYNEEGETVVYARDAISDGNIKVFFEHLYSRTRYIRFEKNPTNIVSQGGFDTLSDESFVQMANLFSQLRRLKGLKFNNCKLNENAINILLESIQSHLFLKDLSLKKNRITSIGLIRCPILPDSLVRLWLDGNAIGGCEDQISKFARGLGHLKNLRLLSLKNCNLDQEDEIVIASNLPLRDNPEKFYDPVDSDSSDEEDQVNARCKITAQHYNQCPAVNAAAKRGWLLVLNYDNFV